MLLSEMHEVLPSHPGSTSLSIKKDLETESFPYLLNLNLNAILLWANELELAHSKKHTVFDIKCVRSIKSCRNSEVM